MLRLFGLNRRGRGGYRGREVHSMLKRQSLLFCAIGCIISAGLVFGSGAGTATTGAPGTHLRSASSVQAQPLRAHALTAGADSESSSYLFRLASGSTYASPGKASPYPTCPGGVNPDIPKPHDGGGGKKKLPGPIVVPCTPNGGGSGATHS